MAPLGTRNTENSPPGENLHDDDEDDDVIDATSTLPANSGLGSEDIPPLMCKPLYVLAKWKHPVTRDSRIAIVVVLPAVILEDDDGVRTEVVDGCTVKITFTWPCVLLDSNRLMGAILSFCPDIDISHGTLLAQGLMDYLESFQSKEGENIRSTCKIPLPFSVKPDFAQDVLSFENSDVRLYLLRFSAPERHFVQKGSRISIHTIRNIDAEAARTITTSSTSRRGAVHYLPLTP